MGAMTVADEFFRPVPVQRSVVFATARNRQRHMTSQRDSVPSDFATVSTSGLNIDCKYEINMSTVHTAQSLAKSSEKLHSLKNRRIYPVLVKTHQYSRRQISGAT